MDLDLIRNNLELDFRLKLYKDPCFPFLQSMGKKNKCAWVGQGVLSKIVTFGDTLFANIAGKVDCSKIQDSKKKKECQDSKKKDLISINAGSGQVTGYRNSWCTCNINAFVKSN